MANEKIIEQPKDKTKDAVLLKNNCVFSQKQFLGSKGAEALANEEVSGIVSDVYAAMDEYAKQQDIAFAKWIAKNRWDVYFEDVTNQEIWMCPTNQEGITTEELHNLFTNESKQG